MTKFAEALSNGAETALPLQALYAVWKAVGSPFRGLVRAYRAQLAINHLRSLDDRLLDDIGISRGEIRGRVRGHQG